MSEDIPWLTWDTGQMIEDWVQSQLEDQKNHPDSHDEIKTEDQLRNEAYEDHDLVSMAWEDLVDALTEWMEEQDTDDWHCTVESFGWQNLSGYKDFSASNGEQLMRQILPDTECKYNIWKIDEGKAIRIRNWHHDSPTGNEYYVVRAAEDGA